MWEREEEEAGGLSEERRLHGPPFPGAFYLEVAGERIELLSQTTDGLAEPWSDAERLETVWDDLREALAYALHESEERGGVDVDVVAMGKVVARVSSPEFGT